jgi:L-lactate dehydrogenase complex protein LldG
MDPQMTSGREAIFGAIKAALGPSDRAAADQRLSLRPRGPQPARGQGSAAELVARFCDEAARVTAELINVTSIGDVPQTVVDLARRHNIAGDFRVAPSLAALDWQAVLDDGRGHNVMFGPADLSVHLGISRGVAGIAETGTILLTSGPDDPMLLAFVAEFHVIVLSRQDVVGGLDDAFDKLIAMGTNPRSACFITGPSRTGDIEMSLEYGAHGPKQLAIILHD